MRLAHPEHQYLDLLQDLLEVETVRPERTGTGTRALFGRRMEFDLEDAFPLLTTKKLPFRVIAHELLWMLSGETNVRPLQAQGVSIWDEWADEVGDLGPVYGKQWRSWAAPYEEIDSESDQQWRVRPIDQIANLLAGLRRNPNSRRHLVTAWNPADADEMALPPCHCLFQFFVEDDGRLSCQMYQRSADAFLGLPFNIASYALLTSMLARVLDRRRGRLVWIGGDVHLYANHVTQAGEQLGRAPRPFPLLSVAKRSDLDSWEIGDFTLLGYEPHPHIAAEVSA